MTAALGPTLVDAPSVLQRYLDTGVDWSRDAEVLEYERAIEAQVLSRRFETIPTNPDNCVAMVVDLLDWMVESPGARFERRGEDVVLVDSKGMTTALRETLDAWHEPICDYLVGPPLRFEYTQEYRRQEHVAETEGDAEVVIAWRNLLPPDQRRTLAHFPGLFDIVWLCPHCQDLHLASAHEIVEGFTCGHFFAPRIAGSLRNLPECPTCGEFHYLLRELPAPKPCPLPLIAPATLAGVPVPKREWLLPEMIPAGAPVMLGGAGGVGKSLLALQLATSFATGKPFLGREMTRGRALGFFCEDNADELHRRQHAINNSYEITFSDLTDLRWASRVAEDNVLMSFGTDSLGDRTGLYDALATTVADFGAGLVIIDASADVFAGNENDRTQVRQFVSSLARLARDTDATIVLLAHPSLTGLNTGSGLSGSTAWNASMRSRLYLDQPKSDDADVADPDLRVLRVMKSNYGPAALEIGLRWQNGVFNPIDPPSGIDATVVRSRADRVFLACLEARNQENRPVSPHPNASTYAPKLFARRPEAEGCSKRELEAAMERVFSNGSIQTESYGRPSRRQTRIVRTKGLPD